MISQRKKTQVLFAIAIFYVLFFPTSIGGVIIGNMWMVKNIFGMLVAVWVWKSNFLDPKAKRYAIASIMVLILFTLVGLAFADPCWGDLRIAWASISGFLPSVLFWCVSFRSLVIEGKSANKLLLILSAIMIIWGWGLVLTVPSIESFTTMWYSSLNEEMLSNMMSRGKPVMSFSTHSVSAFFVTLLFYLHCISLRHGYANILNYICMILLFLLVIPMTSNTAMVMLAIMAILFMWSTKSNTTRIVFVAICVLAFSYYWSTGFINDYIDVIVYSSSADSHGLEARYGSENYFGNIEVIMSIGGIGFLRSNTEFFEMRDSGFIYLLTQGNVILLFLIYLLRYKFLKRNQPYYSWITILLFLLLEFITASAYISVKIVFAEIMVMCFVNSFTTNNKSKSNNGQIKILSAV